MAFMRTHCAMPPHRHCKSEIGARAFRLDRHARIDDGKIIAIGDDGLIRWEGMIVARLARGAGNTDAAH